MSRFATLVILLGGTAILLMGNGLFGTLLGVRASLEAFGIAVTGVIMSAYFLGYVLGSFLCVHAVLRVGHIRTFAALSAILSATAIAHVIFVHPLTWGAFRLLAGLCIVGVFLVIESWLNSSAPPAQRGRVFSVYMTVNLLAVASGQFLLTLADPRDFVLFGVVAMLFALALVPIALARLDAPVPPEAMGLTLRQLFDASPVGVVGCLAAGFVSGSFWGMGAVFGSKVGLSDVGIASFMSTIILGGMAAQWPVGSLSDHSDRRKVIIAVAGAGAGAAGLAAVAAELSFPLLLVAAAAFGATLFPLYSLVVARTHDMLGAGRVLEATRGLILVFGIGAVLGPFTSGWIMEALAPPAMFALFATIFAALTAFAVYRLSRGDPVPPAAQTNFVPLMRTSQQAVEMAQAPNILPEAQKG